MFWSPNGASLGFAHDKRLWKIRADGLGKPEAICGIPETGSIIHGAWGAGDRIVFTVWRGGMYAVSADGGAPEPILPVDHETIVDYHSVELRPDGTPLFDVHPADASFEGVGISVLVDGETRVPLPGRAVRNAVYSPSGHLVYNQSDGGEIMRVMAVPFSAETKRLTGEPFRVANDASGVSVSAAGNLVYTTAVGEETPDRRLVWIDGAGEITPVPGELMERVVGPALSPDDSQVVVAVNIDGKPDLWVQDLVRGVGRRPLPSARFASIGSVGGLMNTSSALPQERRGRRMPYVILAGGCTLLALAFLIGINDNPPGVLSMLAGFFAVALGVACRFGRSAHRGPARQLLYWTPRALCIAFAVFIGLFALDAFDEGQGFWGTSLALLMHLIPTFLLLIVLALSWRREWVGGILFTGLAVLYVVWAWNKPFAAWSTLVLIAGPLVLTGALFLLNWYYRGELRGSAV